MQQRAFGGSPYAPWCLDCMAETLAVPAIAHESGTVDLRAHRRGREHIAWGVAY